MRCRTAACSEIATTRKRVPGGALLTLVTLRRKRDPRGVWLLLTGLVGRGCPLKRAVDLYLWPAVYDAHRASTSHRFRTCGRPSTRTCIFLSRRSGFHRLHKPAQLNKSGGPRGRKAISEISNSQRHISHLAFTCEASLSQEPLHRRFPFVRKQEMRSRGVY